MDETVPSMSPGHWFVVQRRPPDPRAFHHRGAFAGFKPNTGALGRLLSPNSSGEARPVRSRYTPETAGRGNAAAAEGRRKGSDQRKGRLKTTLETLRNCVLPPKRDVGRPGGRSLGGSVTASRARADSDYRPACPTHRGLCPVLSVRVSSTNETGPVRRMPEGGRRDTRDTRPFKQNAWTGCDNSVRHPWRPEGVEARRPVSFVLPSRAPSFRNESTVC